jgi:hypothetical protein
MMARNSSTSNFDAWKRLGVRLVWGLLLVAAADWGMGALLERLYARTEAGDFGGRINFVRRNPSQIVIFGSSRAKHHYFPAVIAQQTEKSVLNAGFDAQRILFFYGLEQVVFEQYLPEIIVLEVNILDLINWGAEDPLDLLAPLLPFNDHPEVAALLKQRGPFESLKLVSKIYPYNSQVLRLAQHNLFPDEEATHKLRGYLPLFGNNTEEIRAAEKRNKNRLVATEVDFNPYYRTILEKFIGSAQGHGVQVVLCRSPLLEIYDIDEAAQDLILDEFRAIARPWDVPLIEISPRTHALFSNPYLFVDNLHLNHEGAQLFSRVFGDTLRVVCRLEEDAAMYKSP